MSETITIQKTSKKWKGLKLVSLLSLPIGLAGSATHIPIFATICAFVFVGGCFGYLFAVAGSWWDHG